MDLKNELELFLKYVNKNCTDRYGHLEVVDTENENIKKDYYSQTIEGIVENYLNDKEKLAESE